MLRSLGVCARLISTVGMAVSLIASTASSQLFHLPPARRATFAKGERMMTLLDSANALSLTFAIDDDRMIVTNADGTTDTIALEDRTLSDIAVDLEKRYKGLRVRTPFPLENARLLGPTRSRSITDVVTSILANPGDAQVDLNFGTVLSLASPSSSDTPKGLLTATGFQLDMIGSYQWAGPRLEQPDSLPAGRPSIQIERARALRAVSVFLLSRLSLSANQQLQISDSGGAQSNSTPGQIQEALQQADQIGLSLQADVVFPLTSERFDFTLSPMYAVSWTRLSDPGLGDITIENKVVPLSEQFDRTLTAKAHQALRQTLPLSEGGVIGTLTFQRHHRPLFYVGGGMMRREVLQPRITYTRPGPDARPDSSSLKASLMDPGRTFWRATFGARIAGLLDVRLDAAGPIGARDIQPLLKFLIGSTFPMPGNSK